MESRSSVLWGALVGGVFALVAPPSMTIAFLLFNEVMGLSGMGQFIGRVSVTVISVWSLPVRIVEAVWDEAPYLIHVASLFVFWIGFGACLGHIAATVSIRSQDTQ